ncbi:hypothetical protein E2A64_08875 [Pseudohoeflea suaedae]|uniref:Uncharacterized protein n=2 Tax=Pseudohoeflea suaedae TaxID=877384 RepID=A0A4R5PQR9_9HYPH|nr:hypothetical protein E2A64_08875 [Pseudohoeflea suaedae]
MPSPAQDAGTAITEVSDRLLFVVSGGFWEKLPESALAVEPSEEQTANEPAEAAPDETPSAETADTEETAPAVSKRGYYRLVAFRAEDNTSRVYLQQMALTDDGPAVETTTEIEELNASSSYVTNIVQEGTGEMGFSAFIAAKTDPSLPEPDTWTVFIDEFGAITIEKATN